MIKDDTLDDIILNKVDISINSLEKLTEQQMEELEAAVRESYWRDNPDGDKFGVCSGNKGTEFANENLSGDFHGQINDIPVIETNYLQPGEVVFTGEHLKFHTFQCPFKRKQSKIDKTRLLQAEAESNNSNCVKHSVGCIITDVNGRILSSGYNGTPAGHQNCCDKFPNFKKDVEYWEQKVRELHEKAEQSEDPQHIMYIHNSIEGCNLQINKLVMEHREWSMQHEIHAEVNALMASDPIKRQGGTLYVNLQPCENCAKMIAGSGVARVVYGKAYHRANNSVSEDLFKASNIQYIHLEDVLK